MATYVVKDDNSILSIKNPSIRICTTEIKVCVCVCVSKPPLETKYFSFRKLINMHSNLVITLYNVNMIRVEPKDQNKSMRDNQAYLRMNSKT
jgi:hypothetical protein